MTRISRDSNAQISLDFMTGLTLFLITLLFIVSFIPNMFVPFRSERVDLTAVAYRTSVVLAEDPGWFSNSSSSTRGTNWEENTNNISRVGLALDKEHPNNLNRSKITAFNNESLIDDTTLAYKLGLYRNISRRSDVIYGYNITLERLDVDYVIASRGETPPSTGDVASVKRLVMERKWLAYVADGDEMEGVDSPTKALFCINKSDVVDSLDEGVFIAISNFNFTGTTPNQQTFDGVKLGNAVAKTGTGYALTKAGTNNDPSGHSSLMDGATGTYYQFQGDLSPAPGWDINNEEDTLEIFMPRIVFENETGLDWSGATDIYIELQFGSEIDVDPALTLPAGTIYGDYKILGYEPAILTVKVW